LPDGSGIDVCRDIRSRLPDVQCLIRTSYDDDEALFGAVMAGAAGYLLKQIGGRSLTDAIRQVAAGGSLMDPAVAGKLLDRLRHPPVPDPRVGSLTARDREILDLKTLEPPDRRTTIPGRENGEELRVCLARQTSQCNAAPRRQSSAPRYARPVRRLLRSAERGTGSPVCLA
jgi:CheY-like chemotaxis protein